jgi:GT2 family glycosyltransferase
MIYFYHDGLSVTQLTNCGDDQLLPKSDTVVAQFFEVAARYPDQNIIWVHELISGTIDFDNLSSKFKDTNYMLSLGAIKNQFLYPEIGYVTDGPFMAVSEKVIYPTWLMQDTAGMVAAAVINQFDVANYKNASLEYFLTSVARLGQPKGLFCYHIPVEQPCAPKSSKNTTALFKFVVLHYKRPWSFLLIFLLFRYENEVPLLDFIKAQFASKIDLTKNLCFQKKISLLEVAKLPDYEVIIPTMGRKHYLKDVLNDFNNQTHLPKKIIIIEQNPEKTAFSDLDFLKDKSWPFIIDHEFIHQTGACNARNKALDKTKEDWVMLFDDDNRFDGDVFQMIFSHLHKLDIKALNTAYLQKGEEENYFQNVQWPTFGSGCSMIHRDVVAACKFDMALEHGYGEDADFGMQIRNAGFDVIYTPSISILHLKAPVGGFRKPNLFPWSKNQLQPKPSPQIMYQRRKNFTLQQLRGYKLTLFLKFYKNQSIKNPITYYSNFKKRWDLSNKWSNTL